MEFLNVLTRDEMRQISGGTGDCYMSCPNCNNDTCRQWVDECTYAGQAQLCGIPAGGSPRGQCVCAGGGSTDPGEA